MKTIKLLNKSIFFILAMTVATSCSDDGDYVVEVSENLKIDFNTSNISFNEDNYWSNVYDTTYHSLTFDNVSFSHQASATEWGGYTYYSWYGFCPSKSTDNTDYSDGDWTSHQWGSITGGGLTGAKDTYLLVFWYSSEASTSIPSAPSCCISYNNGTFNPQKVYITNSAWGYYAMKNGSAFNKQFTEGDWCILHIYGVKNNIIIGQVDVTLANGSDILNTWKLVDLTPLGQDLDMIYFQMTSSDTGTWGINNPTYFCLDNLEINLVE